MKLRTNNLFATPKSTGELHSIINDLPQAQQPGALLLVGLTNNYLAAQVNPELDRLRTENAQLRDTMQGLCNDASNCTMLVPQLG